MRASEALSAAAAVVAAAWTQYVREHNQAYCVLGALIVVCDDDWDLYWRASRTLAEVIPFNPGKLFPLAKCIRCWNDGLDPASGQQTVIRALRRAARLAFRAGD